MELLALFSNPFYQFMALMTLCTLWLRYGLSRVEKRLVKVPVKVRVRK